MKATLSMERGKTLRYQLTADLGGQRVSAQVAVPAEAYAGLTQKDTDDLLKAQLWRQVMNAIEHNLRSNLAQA